jgi:hypothetical protein
MVVALKVGEMVNSIYCSLYFNNEPHTALFTYIVTHLTFVTVMTWIRIVAIKKREE